MSSIEAVPEDALLPQDRPAIVDALVQLWRTPGLIAKSSLGHPKADKERLAALMVSIWDAEGVLVAALDTAFREEFGYHAREGTIDAIGRGNGFAMSAVRLYLQKDIFKSILGSLVNDVLERVEPLDAGDTEATLQWVLTIVETLNERVNLLPRSFRALCHSFNSAAIEYCPESRAVLLGGLVMLRYICPFCCAPNSAYDAPKRKTLVNITRALQLASNFKGASGPLGDKINERLSAFLNQTIVDEEGKDFQDMYDASPAQADHDGLALTDLCMAFNMICDYNSKTPLYPLRKAVWRRIRGRNFAQAEVLLAEQLLAISAAVRGLPASLDVGELAAQISRVAGLHGQISGLLNNSIQSGSDALLENFNIEQFEQLYTRLCNIALLKASQISNILWRKKSRYEPIFGADLSEDVMFSVLRLNVITQAARSLRVPSDPAHSDSVMVSKMGEISDKLLIHGAGATLAKVLEVHGLQCALVGKLPVGTLRSQGRLMTPSRSLVFSGPVRLVKAQENMEAFLFNDGLLLTAPIYETTNTSSKTRNSPLRTRKNTSTTERPQPVKKRSNSKANLMADLVAPKKKKVVGLKPIFFESLKGASVALKEKRWTLSFKRKNKKSHISWTSLRFGSQDDAEEWIAAWTKSDANSSALPSTTGDDDASASGTLEEQDRLSDLLQSSLADTGLDAIMTMVVRQQQGENTEGSALAALVATAERRAAKDDSDPTTRKISGNSSLREIFPAHQKPQQEGSTASSSSPSNDSGAGAGPNAVPTPAAAAFVPPDSDELAALRARVRVRSATAWTREISDIVRQQSGLEEEDAEEELGREGGEELEEDDTFVSEDQEESSTASSDGE